MSPRGKGFRAGSAKILCNHEARSTRSCKFRKLVAVSASLLIASVGLIVTIAAAVNPSLIGQWYTIYQEGQGSNTIYKIEARINKAISESVKTANLEIQIRVTNGHPFAVKLLDTTVFRVGDMRQGHLTLVVFIPESTIPANKISDIFASGRLIKVYGIGHRFVVDGVIDWEEIYPNGVVVGPFEKTFHEIHSTFEFTR